jgi:hypothetical protein
MSSEMTNAQVALTCASRFMADRTNWGSDQTLTVADKFLAWLEKQEEPEA